MSGPLSGVRIVEIASIGPGPFCAMLLSDMGAEVIRVDRAGPAGPVDSESPDTVLRRGRRSIAVDLKQPDGVEVALSLIDGADGLLEGFRPGVAERLGIGPEVCLARNRKLVYGRVTGWGQEGPYAPMAGHDINYIALTGALRAMGRAGEPPPPPLNIIGDYGGGGMLLMVGMLCGLLEAQRSGQGQVVDAAMVDGIALLTTIYHGLRAAGEWNDKARGNNSFDGGAPYYDTYETADGGYVSIGSVEPHFYAELLRITGLTHEALPDQDDRSNWPAMKDRFRALFRTRTRDEWCQLMDGSDVCFAPVLSFGESPGHPHISARGVFIERDGVTQPAPAPRFSRTPGRISRAPARPGEHTDEILRELGFDDERVSLLRKSGAINRP